MNSMIKSLVIALLLVTGVTASVADDIQIYTTDNSNAKITGESIEKVFTDAGFVISGNNDMNPPFKGKFQETYHKVYRLFTYHNNDLLMELVKVSPRAALFAPLSSSIYMKNGSNDISISTLSLDGMAKITGISATNKHMIEYDKLIKETIAKALPNGHFEKITFKPLKAKNELVTIFTYEMDLEEGDDLEDELDGLEVELEGSLETAGFVIAGFNKLGEDFADAGYDKYDFFDAYSICKLRVIFEVHKTHPEAGALAPCSLYLYKEKGSSVVHMAYPSVYNWFSSLAISDKASVDVLVNAQKVMVDVINEVTE